MVKLPKTTRFIVNPGTVCFLDSIQNAGSLLTPDSDTVFMLFHKVNSAPCPKKENKKRNLTEKIMPESKS